jgi:hypothetical protein
MNVRRGSDPNSIIPWFVWLILEPLIWLFGFSDEESGQRHLFQSTSAAFGGRGVLWKGKPDIIHWRSRRMDYFSSIISATVLRMRRLCLCFERRRWERFGTIRRKFFDHICRLGTIGACAFEARAPEPGPFSFTNILIKVLDAWKWRPMFSAAMLHSELLARLKHPRPHRDDLEGCPSFEDHLFMS